MPPTDEFTHDVFISYCPADADWVWDRLIPRLQAEKLVFHTEEQFRLGPPKLLNYEQAVENSRYVLLILSPEWVRDGYTEFTSFLAQHSGLTTQKWRTIPLLLRPCSLPPRIDSLTRADLTGGRDEEAEIARLIATLRGEHPDGARPQTGVFRRPLSSLHLDYLGGWFGKSWATVNLADISSRQERASLLDVYVPLPVDFKLDIEVKDHQIVDWWVHREAGEEFNAEAQRRGGAIRRGGLQPPDTPDDDTDRAHEIEAAKERLWADLGVGEAELEKIVQQIQEKIDARIADGQEYEDGTGWWYMEAHDAASVQPRFVLLGEPGGGKSSFLRHLALCLAGELRRRAGEEGVPEKASLEALRDWLLDTYTPIYIELRDITRSHFPPLSEQTRAPGVDEFWAYIRERLLGPGLAGFESELRGLCRSGDAILLLDGLDEIPQAGDERRREQVKAFIAALIGAYPRLRVIVSSRPHAYRRGEWALDSFGRAELEALLPSRLHELAQALFRVVTPEADGKEATDFIRAVEQTSHIEKDLHRNPLFFTLLAALWLASPPDDRRLPATRADLYRQAVDLLLGRWTRRRAPEPSVAESLGILDPEHLRPVLESLACGVNEQRNPEQDATAFGVESLLGILFRAGFQTGLHDVPDYLTQHAGILVSPEAGEFVFVHRSFQEHLAACELTYPQPEERIPAVPVERRFPQGLVRRVLERPDLWENVARLAGDELLAQQRENDLWRLLVEMVRPYLTKSRSSTSSEKSNFSDGVQAAFLALEIARQYNLFAVERDEFDPLAHSAGVLRRVAVAVLTDYENFEPEQRLIAGQLLGSRPGLDPRPGVGIVETQNFVSLPDIAWVKISKLDQNGQDTFIYQEEKHESPDDFWMARYPITYAQFKTFKDADDGWRNSHWWDGLALNDQDSPGEQRFPVWNHPRENVSWYQAIAFCRWLTEQARQHPKLLPEEVRDNPDWRNSLPTEWQWEKAARGHDGRQYTWGSDTYQPGYANINETRESAGPHNLQSTSAVGMYPQGATPSGLLDLSGNVWEWCLSKYDNSGNIQVSGSETRVLRGGSWYSYHNFASAVRRNRRYPLGRFGGLGFRVVWSASVPVTSGL